MTSSSRSCNSSSSFISIIIIKTALLIPEYSGVPSAIFPASEQQLTARLLSASTDLSWIKRVGAGSFFSACSIVRYNDFSHRGKVALLSATSSHFLGILIRFSGPSSGICMKLSS